MTRKMPLRYRIGYAWACLVDFCFWRWYIALCWRYCQRHGHKWGKSGTYYIPGEPTVHWAVCKRCGYGDSD